MKVKCNTINLYLFYKFTNYRDTAERENMFTLEKKTTSNWKSKLLSQETRKRSNKALSKDKEQNNKKRDQWNWKQENIRGNR